jgi:hypothetical protein
MPDFIIITTPWGLVSRRPEERIEFSEPQAIGLIPVGSHPMLFCDTEATPVLNDDPDALERQAMLRDKQGSLQGFYALPVPLRTGRTQTLRKQNWNESAEFSWGGALSRPSSEELENSESNPACQQFLFLLGLVGRMQDFDEALSEEGRFLPWEVVFYRWLESEARQDPTMDILVRHAIAHRSRWADITERPRRLLNRARELVPLSRVEELDTHCMEWLSHQPGRTTAQRAGPRQRIMAIARYENLDTLENRVFRNLLERTDAAARDYLRQNSNRRLDVDTRGRTSRYRLVERYSRECRRLAREMDALGVTRLEGLVQPNFVLMQDDRYKFVWSAWQQIVKRDRELDDLWSWQRRAWAEFAKAACGVALLATHGGELEVASPLSFRMEHRRGEWLVHDDPLLILAFRDHGFVIEVLDGRSGDLAKALPELGASTWLRISNLEGGEHRYIAVWTTLGMAQELSLRELVESSNKTVEFLRQVMPTARLTGGLVLLAETNPNVEATLEASEFVTGLSFGPFDRNLPVGLAMLGDEIVELVKAAL